MQRKIAYIVNPISGTKNKKAIEQVIVTETEKVKLPFRFFESIADGNYGLLKETIIKDKITDVVIVGGDGTVGGVLNGLIGLPVRFGIIAAGSGNGLALGAGLPKTPKRALGVIFNNHTQPIDVFKINEKFGCMLCGLGFDAQIAHEFAHSNQRGLATYVRKVISNFTSAKKYHFKIKANHKRFETDAYFISIANSNQFGNNFTIAPKASLTDGKLDIVIVTDQSKVAFFYNVIKQVVGLNALCAVENINQNKSVIYFQTEELTITNSNNAPLHIDGDPIEKESELSIKIKPAAFNLFTKKTNI